MKLKTIALAFAIAASSQAFAHGPSVTPDLNLYIAGSSAQLNTLQNIADNMFVAGTIDHYSDTTKKVGANYRAYFGTVASGYGTASGKKMLLVERGKGGSFMGVGPLARGETISFMDVSAGKCTAIAGAVYPDPTYLCGAGAGNPSTISVAPDLGVSDEEPGLFTDLNLPTSVDTGVSKTGLSAAEFGRITAQSEYNVLMGIAATNSLPLSSLSRAQIAAILSGGYSTWDQVDPSLSGNIIIETRAAGSGTKAASNAYFLNAPCGKAVGAAASPAAAAAGIVIENGSTGAVQAALDADSKAGKMAIGILGLDAQPGTTYQYKFLSIDGIAPTTANAVSGAYDYFVGQSIQYRKVAVNGARAGTAGTTWGDAAQGFIASATNPAIVTALAGVALDPAISPMGNGYDEKTTKGTRGGNTCAPLSLWY
jgi:hypothetical protein